MHYTYDKSGTAIAPPTLFKNAILKPYLKTPLELTTETGC